MARDFYEVVSAKGGFAGEYEQLTEAEIAASPSGSYTPGSDDGVFKIVSSRIVQLLNNSPVYIETFQTSAATVRVPSGAIGTNDAEDGRWYFFRNSNTATGNITVETSGGSSLGTLVPGDVAFLFHGDDDNWDFTLDVDTSYIRYSLDVKVPGSGTRYLSTGNGIFTSDVGDFIPINSNIRAVSISVNIADTANNYDLEILSDPAGSPTTLIALSLTSGNRTASIDNQAVAIAADTEIGARLVRTSGGGVSDFDNVNVFVVLERTT